MSTLGIGVSTQDPVYGWEDLKPTHHVDPRLAEALAEARELWNKVTGYFGESLLAAGNYDALNELTDQAMAAETKAHLIYQQLNCAHKNTHAEGGFHYGDEEDDVKLFCDDCGLEVGYPSSPLTDDEKLPL